MLGSGRVGTRDAGSGGSTTTALRVEHGPVLLLPRGRRRNRRRAQVHLSGVHALGGLVLELALHGARVLCAPAAGARPELTRAHARCDRWVRAHAADARGGATPRAPPQERRCRRQRGGDGAHRGVLCASRQWASSSARATARPQRRAPKAMRQQGCARCCGSNPTQQVRGREKQRGGPGRGGSASTRPSSAHAPPPRLGHTEPCDHTGYNASRVVVPVGADSHLFGLVGHAVCLARRV